MNRKNVQILSFTRRTVILGGIQLTAISALLGRLYYLQFIKSELYKVQAEDNRINVQLSPPERGVILDRKGAKLVDNQPFYRIVIERGIKDDSLFSLERLATILALPADKTKQLRTQLSQLQPSRALTIKEPITRDEMAIIEFHAPSLPGVGIEAGQVRHYPLGEDAAHLLGYVGAPDAAETEADALLKTPGFKVGKAGAEKLLEDRLRGRAGMRQFEVNAHGLLLRELAREPSIKGEAVHLTIDDELQRFSAERLGEESGSIVVMDVNNGDILTMVAMPAYDSNLFSGGISNNYWKELNDNPKNPLMNKSISGQYPPGSTFKMMVGLAGLEAGIIAPDSSVFCPGHFFLGTHMFKCWKQGGHGSVDLVGALAGSCDTFFYSTAQALGIEAIAKMARKFGLGVPPGLGLTGEKSGLIPSPEWKIKNYKDAWRTGDSINAGIGQGYVLSTPLQLAVMTARIANGGIAVSPNLIMHKERLGEFPEIDVSPDNLAIIQKGMEAVCNQPSGTAYAQRINDEDFLMAGKTGTSQVRRIIQQGVDQSRLPWLDRHHALFVGYAPIEAPKYAISVLVEHGGGGASAAAPIARDVLQKVQEIYS